MKKYSLYSIFDFVRICKLLSNLKYLTVFFLLQIPAVYGQKNKDVEIILECVEYIGNDKYTASFGYNNPNKTEIIVAETNSLLYINDIQPGKKVLNKFLPGRHSNVFQTEFATKDRVLWHVILPNGTPRDATASINSVHCSGSSNIFPYYPPPAGGKVTNTILGPELYSLYQSYTTTGTAASNFIYQVSDSKVLIDIKVKAGCYDQILTAFTNNYGFVWVHGNPGENQMTGWLPVTNLIYLDNYASCLEYIRPEFPSLLENGGLALNKGDFAIRSDFVRNGYDISGQGVKIGVLSDSYDSKGKASQDVENGDLPGPGNIDGNYQPVQVLKDYPYSFTPMSDEGRAMLQIIHDIAPKADLAFRTGYISPGDMAAGITELANAGCQIIVDDISFITEPFFRDGKIATTVNNVVSGGVTYFTAAGNYGRKSWSDVFNPYPATLSATLSGNFHNFSNGDIYQNISLAAGNYILVMQWEDAEQAANDFDIYLANTNGTILFGFNRNNLGTEPIEILPFTVTGSGATTNILINRASGTGNPRIKYIVFRGDLVINEYNNGNATIISHANAAGAITVGAVKYDNTPYYGVNPPTISSFSSVGGVPVNGITRQKPDITAPNGVNTTVKLSDYDLDGDGNFEFYGTSAAAPHAAAVAALLKEAKVKYANATLTPEQIRQLLQSTAIDMDQPGFDYTTGYGFIQADKAILTFANPDPELIKLIVPGGINPGTNTFTVTAKGDYLTGSTTIIMDGDSLQTHFINDSTVTADVPLFNGNPSLIAYTPPKSDNQNDGGFSDPVYFFGITKKNMTIKANNASKKYGEQLPALTFTITVDGQPFTRGDLTNAEYQRITDVHLTTSVTSLSDAGAYKIRPGLVPPIGSITNESDPLYLIDKSIAAKFNITFEDGTLTIGKLPLTITPNDLTFTYGDRITASDVTFKYDLDLQGLNITEADKQTILGNAMAAHSDALSDYVLFVNGTTIFSGITIINGVPLSNLNGIPLIDGTADVNGHEVSVVDGVTYIDGTEAVDGIPIINNIPIVNDFPLVNALDIDNGGQALINNVVVGINNQMIVSVDGITLPEGIPLIDGVPLITGTALVNGLEVSVQDGVLTIDGMTASGTTEVDGIPIINGIPIVNTESIINGSVLYDDVPVMISDGTPMVDGVPIINVNPYVNGITLINANQTQEMVELADMNMLVSETAISNSLSEIDGTPIINGIQLVNGLESNIADESLLLAANHTQEDGTVTDEEGNVMMDGVPIINGISLVDGVALVNGIIMINGTNASNIVNGINLINSETINQTSNQGSILIFDNLDLTSTVPPGFMPVSFITGNTVGMHWIVPGTFLSNNFNISYGIGILTVEKAPLTVSIGNASKVYGNPDPVSFSWNITSGTLFGEDLLTGVPARVAGEMAGDYLITRGTLSAGPSYKITFVNGKFTIDKAILTVKAQDQVIFAGDPLPSLTFTYSGFRFNDTPLSVFGTKGPDYQIIPQYAGAAGTYQIMPVGSTANYIIQGIAGTLYVNPAPIVSKAIRPVLVCIDILNPPVSGFTYIAHFRYENPNTTDIFIPVGPNNKITGKGGFDASGQPTLFRTSGGDFYVPFDGQKIVWEVTSMESGRKAAVGSVASSTSSRCSAKSGIIPETAGYTIGYLYPNPATDKVTLEITSLTENPVITVTDLRGVSYFVSKQIKNDNQVEMDIRSLPPGIFIISLSDDTRSMQFRLIKIL